jgi:ubiquinone/menaquinone biosynthesis C-methylase UbiE
MGFVSVLSFAHRLLAQRIKPGDRVIDATLGTGVDTLQLARLVGKNGRVYGFDIQQQALDQTSVRLDNELPDASAFVELYLCSHAQMEAAIADNYHGSIAAVTFNLGYLPGAETETITMEASTISALEASLRLLRKGGIITVVLYTGHIGGTEEAEAVESWAQQLSPAGFQVVCYQFVNRSSHAPYLLAIEKR